MTAQNFDADAFWNGQPSLPEMPQPEQPRTPEQLAQLAHEIAIVAAQHDPYAEYNARQESLQEHYDDIGVFTPRTSKDSPQSKEETLARIPRKTPRKSVKAKLLTIHAPTPTILLLAQRCPRKTARPSSKVLATAKPSQ